MQISIAFWRCRIKPISIMGWVNDALRELAAGRSVQIRPYGGSMCGRIESGDLVTLAPVEPREVKPGDVVLVSWKGGYLLHLVLEVGDGRLLIGNAIGKTNGWVESSAVRGRVTAVIGANTEQGANSTERRTGLG